MSPVFKLPNSAPELRQVFSMNEAVFLDMFCGVVRAVEWVNDCECPFFIYSTVDSFNQVTSFLCAGELIL